ncbi:MAG: succinylglutamate desuccinylase/aspartoacylase family protein [Rubrivivax sp.]|nr:succinylglutamate desuccinylase/aspartoacylase family protein [Rubrivivax sp.]
MTTEAPLFEVAQRDLSAYRQGNAGVDYVHRFDSGKPGPHVLINALTHGNEICGMVAATHLLDSGVRPKIGTLTVSFANIEAYNAFDPQRPYDNRQLVHNLNRIWSAEQLGSSEDSPELRRARELRPVVAAADHILDIHSTRSDVEPFWVYAPFERNMAAMTAIGRPAVHLVMPGGLRTGVGLTHHGRHGTADGPGATAVVECGQHFKRSAADLATAVTLDFLAHFGLIERREPARAAPPAPRRYELLATHLVKSTDFAFTRPVIGFETFDDGELIARNGSEEIRSLCDGCTIFMPTQQPIVGREAVYLTRRLA